MGMTNANISMRPAAPLAATAPLPNPESSLVMTLAEIGISTMLRMPGIPKPRIRLHVVRKSRIFQPVTSSRRCFRYSSRNSQPVETACAITVARAEPRIPIAGSPSQPKIRKGLSTALRAVPMSMKRLAALESPVEIRMPFPIMGSDMNMAPRYQMRINCLMSGRVSAFAPSPMACETSVVTPVPIPPATQVSSMTTGNVSPWPPAEACPAATRTRRR